MTTRNQPHSKLSKVTVGATVSVIGLHALAGWALVSMSNTPLPPPKIEEAAPIEIQLITLPPKNEEVPKLSEEVPKPVVLTPVEAKTTPKPKSTLEPEAIPEPKSMLKPEPVALTPVEPKSTPKSRLTSETKPISESKPESTPQREPISEPAANVATQDVQQQPDWMIKQQPLQDNQAQRDADRLAAQKMAADKLAADKRAADKRAADKLAADKRVADKQAADKLAADKRAADKRAADKRAADKRAADKRAADKLAADKLAADKLAADKLAADKLAADKLAADKLAAASNEPHKMGAGDIRWIGRTPNFQPSTQATAHMSRGEIVRVIIKITVDKQGNVANVDLIKSSGYNAIDREVQRKAYQSKLHPYTLNGVAVVGEATLPITVKSPR